MKAAVVESFDASPRYGEFSDPVAGEGEVLVEVKAVGLTQLIRGQASGRHYSSSSALPLAPGNDGVGFLADGRRVYFFGTRAPFGSMAERTVVRAESIVELPAEISDVTAAAIANPGMSSWAALTHRARLRTGETVLVQGATGVAGRLAVQIAKHLGAARVIATGRDLEALTALRELGADQTISLSDADNRLEKVLAEGVDVILDYLWGPPAERLLGAIKSVGARSLRYVQIGSIAGAKIELAGDVLRSTGLELMGSGLGSVPDADLLSSIDGVFRTAVPAGFRIDTEVASLADVAEAWNRNTGSKRLVLVV